jgi:hypothetical protein
MIALPAAIRPWLFRVWMAMMVLAMLVAVGEGFFKP